jgi:hypothetical protein
MATQPTSDLHVERHPQASWLPMVIIAMAQILMIFNISSLQVSIEGIVASFSTLASTMGTAIVTHSVAAGCQSRPSRHLGCIYRSCWRGKALEKQRESPLCIAPRCRLGTCWIYSGERRDPRRDQHFQ